MEIMSITDLVQLISPTNEIDLRLIGKTLYPPVKTTFQINKPKKIRPEKKLGAILKAILTRQWLSFSEIVPNLDSPNDLCWSVLDQWMQKIANTKSNDEPSIKNRTLKRYMQKLTDLHWVVRVGKGQYTSYRINPFLLALTEMINNADSLCEYASLKIDFFDLLNLPLRNILLSNKKLKDLNFSFYSFRKDGTFKMFIKEWFRGALLLNFIFEDDEEKLTILPVNLHGQQVYAGLDENGKRKYRLFEHNCIPIKWWMFDIDKTSYYSKQGDKERVNIHFDHSFSLIVDKDEYGKKTPYYNNYIKPWEHSAKKFDKYEYLEFNDFNLVEALFRARFVKQKRKQELINYLNLKLQSLGGRGNKKNHL